MTAHKSKSTLKRETVQKAHKLPSLTAVNAALVKFNATEKGLADLETKYSGVVYDVTTAEGLEAAKAAKKEIAAPRIQIEKLRKAAKKPILELGRDLDGRAKKLTARIAVIENPIDAQLDIAAAAEKVEVERIQKLEQKIAEITATVDRVILNQFGTDDIKKIADNVCQVEITAEEFGDLATEAEERKNETLVTLRRLYAEAKQREHDAKELTDLREEKRKREAAELAAAEPEPEPEVVVDTYTRTVSNGTDTIDAETGELLETEKPGPRRGTITAHNELPTEQIKPPTKAHIVSVVAHFFNVEVDTADKWIRASYNIA